MLEADEKVWLDTLPEKTGMYWERCNNTGRRRLIYVRAEQPHSNPLLAKQAMVWVAEMIKGLDKPIMLGQLVKYRNKAYRGLKSWCGPDMAPPSDEEEYE